MTAHEKAVALNAQANAAAWAQSAVDKYRQCFPIEYVIKAQEKAAYWQSLAMSHLCAE